MPIMVIIINLTMIVCGYLFIKFNSRKVKHFSGYRTERSCKNEDTWSFAQKYAGKVWIISGIIALIVSLICVLVFKGNIKEELECFQLIMLFMVYPLTEVKLRKVFDKNGIRKRI